MGETNPTCWPFVALEGVGDLIGDPHPGFVAVAGGRRVVFANAAARAAGLLSTDHDAPAAGPLCDRLARFAGRATPGEETRELLRVTDAGRTVLRSIVFTRPVDDDEAVIVRLDGGDPRPEHASPDASLAPFVADGGLAALFTADGSVIAATGDHRVVDGLEEAIETVLSEADEIAVLERTVAAADRRHRLVLVRLGGRPDARNLLWIGPDLAAPATAGDEAPVAPAPETAATSPLAAIGPEPSGEASIVDEPGEIAPVAPTATDDAMPEPSAAPVVVDDLFPEPPVEPVLAATAAEPSAPRDDAPETGDDFVAAPPALLDTFVGAADLDFEADDAPHGEAPAMAEAEAPSEATADPIAEDTTVAEPDLAEAMDLVPASLDHAVADPADAEAADATVFETEAAEPLDDVPAPVAVVTEIETIEDDTTEAEPEVAEIAAAEAEIAEAVPAAEALDEVEPSTAPLRAFAAPEHPVKFVWQMDADHRFTMMSPEFAEIVGPGAADVVGRTWAEVAEALSLDPIGAVARALTRRDTWSGCTVAWPVAGTALRLPVDLAALPLFGARRSFAGYRGFGTCRAATTLPDPTGTGLRLPSAAVPALAHAEAEPVAEPEPDATLPTPADDDATPAPIAEIVEAIETALPVEISTATPVEIDTATPVEIDTATPVEVEAATPVQAESAAPVEIETTVAEPAPAVVEPDLAAPLADLFDVVAPDAPVAEPTAEPLEAPTAPDVPPAAAADLATVAESEANDAPTAPVEELPPPPIPEPTIAAPLVDESPAIVAAPVVAPAPAQAVSTPLSADGRVVSLGTLGRLPADATRLSPPERLAFEQIAEALGARMEGTPTPARGPRSAETASASTRTSPRAAGRSGVASADPRLVDRLPFAVALIRDDALIAANDRFLGLLRYPDLDALRAAGGLDALFAGEHVARRFERDGDGMAVPLIAADGTVIPGDVHLVPVTIEGASGLMLTLAELPAPRRDEPTAAPAPLAAPIAAAPAAPVAAATSAAVERVAELEAIVDTATDGVLILDADGLVLSANAAAEVLFGAERRAMIGRPITDRLAPESRRSVMDYLDGLARNGVASVLNDGREVIGVVAPEGLIPLFVTIGRLGAGPVRKYCAVLRDITQWKKSEEELTTARRRAEEASIHKSDFLAKISHEIRTPLNAIIGFSELMIDERFGPVGNERYKDYLRDIHVSGSHIMSLINDLLDLSKVEAGKMDLRFEAVVLAEVVGECVALMQPQANRERIIIRSSLPASVPAVVADPRSVRQVVLNLLSNAVKFTPAGGQVIVSTTFEDDGEVVLRVRDTGYGMSEKELQLALEPFRQLHTTRSRSGGTGLGLPLTKALVEANRAVFRIDSTVGQGTLVSIAFPATRVLAS